jgi:hypothetical protein
MFYYRMEVHVERIVLMLFCVLSLFGCAIQLAEKQTEPNANFQENASQAAERARKDMLLFSDCLREYAIQNGQSSVTADGLAEAAVRDLKCQSFLVNYEMDIESYHSNLGRSTTQSLDEFQQISDNSRYIARIKRQQLLETGKRQVLNLLIELRR